MKGVSSNPFARVQDAREDFRKALSERDSKVNEIYTMICSTLNEDPNLLDSLKEEGELKVQIWFSGGTSQKEKNCLYYKYPPIKDAHIWNATAQNILIDEIQNEFGPLPQNPSIHHKPHNKFEDDLALIIPIANIRNLFKFAVTDQGMSFEQVQPDQVPHEQKQNKTPFSTMFAEAERTYVQYSGNAALVQKVIQEQIFREDCKGYPVTPFEKVLEAVKTKDVEYRIIFNTYEKDAYHTFDSEPQTKNYFNIDETKVTRISAIFNNDDKRLKIIDVALIVNELAKLCRENGYKWHCGFVKKIVYTLSFVSELQNYKHEKICTVFSILIPAKKGNKVPEAAPPQASNQNKMVKF